MHIDCDDKEYNSQVLDLAHNLYGFMKDKFQFSCEPRIKFVTDNENAKNPLAKTGHYNPSSEEITVYISNRHGKDVLRSLAHELLHHIQGCEGMVSPEQTSGTADPNYILHDDFLKKVEADAFERGNICFREWEAYIKEGMSNMNNLEEKKKGKIPKSKLSKYKVKVKKIADKIKKQQPNIPDKNKFRIAADAAKSALNIKETNLEEDKKMNIKEQEVETIGGKKVAIPSRARRTGPLPVGQEYDINQEEESLEEEVEINEALKNSLYYVKEDRALADAYERRDEKVYNELLRKFGIKK